MDINSVIRLGPPDPRATHSVPKPAPPVRPAPESTETAVRAEPRPPRHSEARPAAIAAFAERQAANARAGTRLHLDAETDRIVAQIVNTNNAVIRQIPPEEVLQVAARFRDLVGLLFDERV